MRRAARLLLGGFEAIWIAAFVLLWLSIVLRMIGEAPDLMAGLGRVGDWMSPFNVSYYLTTVVLLSPALAAHWLRGKLKDSVR